MSRQAGWLAAILLLTAVLYTRVLGAPLVSYDDWLETHRAAFEDTRDPARVFTTSHFGTFKYRPFNRGLNLLTWHAGGGSPVAFRVRNLACHLLNVLLVAALATRLLRSAGAGTLAAGLFAIHPLTDQIVIGAVMTNTAAHGLLLGGLLCWLRALDDPERAGPWPAVGIALAGASLLFYDSALTFFPTVALYAAIVVATRGARAIPPRLVVTFLLGSAIVLGIYFGLRAAFVPSGFGAATADRAGLGAMLRNAALYGAAMLVPIDPVLANAWLHVPLPSEFGRVPEGPWLVGSIGAAAVVIASLVAAAWRRRMPGSPGGATALFLLGAIALSLAPVLILSSHASETYVYLPMAFVAMLLAHALSRLAASRRALAVACVAVFALLCSAATFERNERVRVAGRAGARILASLPAGLARGAWQVALADLPGQGTITRYGFYAFRGTGTIGAPPHADEALTCALQLHFRNPELQGRVLPPPALAAACAAGAGETRVLAWVHADGRLEPCGAERTR